MKWPGGWVEKQVNETAPHMEMVPLLGYLGPPFLPTGEGEEQRGQLTRIPPSFDSLIKSI